MSNRPPEGLSLVLYALGLRGIVLGHGGIKLGMAAWIAHAADNVSQFAPGPRRGYWPPAEVCRRVRESRCSGCWVVLRQFDVDAAEARAICKRFERCRMTMGSRADYLPDPELIDFIQNDPRGRPWDGRNGKALGVEPAPVMGKLSWWDRHQEKALPPPPIASVGLGARLARRRNG